MKLIKSAVLGLTIISIALMSILFLNKVLKVKIPFIEIHREISFSKSKVNFSIGILSGKDPFHLVEEKAFDNPILTAGDVSDINASFVADPFIVHNQKKLYLFFEAMNVETKTGDIGVAVSEDGISWSYQQIVLDEPFHLSYPQVFNEDNAYYMIPETSVLKEIRLYKSTKFPTHWQFDQTLIKGLNFSDSTIFKYNDKWWIFTETEVEGDGVLRLFWANNLYGPWIEHPKSPIVNGNENIARPAGEVLFYQNKLFRVAQDDYPTYGNKVRIFQIDMLSTETYLEHELHDLPEIKAEKLAWGLKTPAWRLDGFHQFSLVKQRDDGSWIVCIDGQTRKNIHRQAVIKFNIPFTKETLSDGNWVQSE